MLSDTTFDFDIVAQGAYIDRPYGDETLYHVEATTIRLNHVALNEWIMSQSLNVRECYEDGEAGDREFDAHKVEYAQRHEAWKAKIMGALGIDTTLEGQSICITQALSEVFTVVRICEV